MRSAVASKLAVLLLAVAACRTTTEPKSPATETESGAATQAEPGAAGFAEQASRGQELYGEYCADCHGASGQGTDDAPAVVGLGEGALPLEPPPGATYRKTRFETVADVAAFVVENMPPDDPGSLTKDEYLAILAFDLKANGIDLGDKTLDMELAKTLTIPRE